jgi:hypothetical protein
MVLADKNVRTPQDTSRINLVEEWEVTYWCDRYGVTHEVLRAVVTDVGPRTQDVEARLRETGQGKKIFSNTGED